MRTVRTVVARCAALLAMSGAPVGVVVCEDPVTAAESAAKAGAELPEGKAFGERLGQAFGREHGVTIQRCARGTKRAELSDFALLLRVDETGVVDQALVKPATNLASCVQDRMKGWRTSLPPPRAPFWVSVGVNLKRK